MPATTAFTTNTPSFYARMRVPSNEFKGKISTENFESGVFDELCQAAFPHGAAGARFAGAAENLVATIN